jgi:hypothetical protein
MPAILPGKQIHVTNTRESDLLLCRFSEKFAIESATLLLDHNVLHLT